MPSDECPICNSRFSQSRELETHAWESHQVCHFCGSEHDSKEGIYKHWLVVHNTNLTERQRKKAESRTTVTLSDKLSKDYLTAVGGKMSKRRFLHWAVGLGGLAFAGVGVNVMADSTTQLGSTSRSADVVETAPITNNPTSEYAVMGAASAPASIEYVGSWKCPACASFSSGFLRDLAAKYVEPGDLQIKYRNLAFLNNAPFLGSDAPAAGHAGLEVWNQNPEAYWTFHEEIFSNQPPEGKQWATADRLAAFASSAGVENTDAIRAAINEQRYSEELQKTANWAEKIGVSGTPSLIINGDPISPSSRQTVHNQIEDLIESRDG
jgi:protein-disulfide isomerase